MVRRAVKLVIVALIGVPGCINTCEPPEGGPVTESVEYDALALEDAYATFLDDQGDFSCEAACESEFGRQPGTIDACTVDEDPDGGVLSCSWEEVYVCM